MFLTRPDCLGAGLALRERLEAFGWPKVEASEVGLMLVELAMNTVRHAGGGRAEISVESHRVIITIDDDGPGFPPWVLERWRRGEEVEVAFLPTAPGVAVPARRGLGAGLDAARRLSHSLELSNRPQGGARAVATRLRHGTTR